jgi:lipopolysaccharide transport system permease protein
MSNTTQEQEWESEIKSEDSLFSINFGEVWQYRDLLMMLVKKDYITFYKQTILGPIWFFVQPILTTLIYVLLFGQIAKLSTDGIPQIAFYLSGITIWNYFSESLTKTSTVFKDNAAVMGKVYFPRLIMPLSIIVSGLMKFGIQFALLIAVVLYYTFVEVTIHPNIIALAFLGAVIAFADFEIRIFIAAYFMPESV